MKTILNSLIILLLMLLSADGLAATSALVKRFDNEAQKPGYIHVNDHPAYTNGPIPCIASEKVIDIEPDTGKTNMIKSMTCGNLDAVPYTNIDARIYLEAAAATKK